MEVVPFGGWQRCARITSGDIEAIVTLEVGPRILRFGRIGGENELAVYDRHAGLTGGDSYRSYGGHRLWVAPEHVETTYEPDNHGVETWEDGETVHFQAPIGPVGIQKSLAIRPIEGMNGIHIVHRLTNTTAEPVELALWTVTVMAPGGECLIPQAGPRPHTEALLPARPVVLWHYTDMQDPRWTWGTRVIRLRQTETGDSQKFGALVQQGIAVYANHNNVFIKRFPCVEGANYPDFGCNFEAFTRTDMLELEALSPLVTLAPGEHIELPESWYLEVDALPPSDDTEAGEFLEELASSHPLRGEH